MRAIKYLTAVSQEARARPRTHGNTLPLTPQYLFSKIEKCLALLIASRGECGAAFKNIHDGKVAVSVKDQGIGIAPHYLASVFEMFSQAESSIHRSQGGLGIGLSLAKGLVELHGGSINVHSEGLNRGSEFVVHLSVVDRARSEHSSRAGDGSNESPVSGLRLLVVDDNRDAAMTLADLLELNGAIIAIASDGVEALQLAETFVPQMVLLDIGLPGMNGYEVRRALRRRSWPHSMQIVALTGWGQETDRAQSRDAGFDGHLVKPVDFEALLTTIARRA